MKNMKISAKLILSFSIVALLTLTVGIVGIIGLKTIDNSYTDAYIKQTKPLPDMAKILEYSQRLRVQFRNVILYKDDPAMLASTEADVTDRTAQFEKYLDAYDATIVNDEARAKFDEARKIYENTYKPALLKAIDDAKAGASTSQLVGAMTAVTDASNTMVDNFSRCMDIKIEAADANSNANTDTANFVLWLMVGVVAAAVVIAMILGLYISRIISAPTKLLSDMMKELVGTGNFNVDKGTMARLDGYSKFRDETGVTAKSFEDLLGMISEKCVTLESVAGGDLTTDVALRSGTDTIGNALKMMVDNLNKMFSEINSSSNQVSTGSVQIADGAQLLAQGATEQSATVEELSASITQIAEQTKLNAGTANEAQTLSENIRQSAEQGNRQMDQMMVAVQEINESSKSISKVIKIIDDIAFQTNILALNAAVEAARAGQHGKGFAVVADEVRSLAAKSAEAAKNTNELIETSIQKAEQGAAISQETSESLKKIVEGILRSSELISEIAKSSAEQSTAISQVSDGIEQVSQVVQQNSATAEQSAAASEEMSGQATLLQQLIAQFKIKEDAAYGQMSVRTASSGAAYMSAPASTGYSLTGGDKY